MSSHFAENILNIWDVFLSEYGIVSFGKQCLGLTILGMFLRTVGQLRCLTSIEEFSFFLSHSTYFETLARQRFSYFPSQFHELQYTVSAYSVVRAKKLQFEFEWFHPVVYVWQIYCNVPSLHNIKIRVVIYNWLIKRHVSALLGNHQAYKEIVFIIAVTHCWSHWYS